MRQTRLAGFILVAWMFSGASFPWAQPAAPAEAKEPSSNRLAVLWTSGDPEVAQRACLMYTHVARRQKWFDEVVLIVWGPSARLLAADEDIQAKVKAMMRDGVKVQACVACADSYGISAQLRGLGLEVKGMGEPLSDMLKEGWKVLTY